MSAIYDIAVVGSGFAGSIFAMIARRLGRSVVLLERGKHPRFMIGESSTLLSNLLLEDLANRYDLPALKQFTKWGSWQRNHPRAACGVKRGFSFFHHDLERPRAMDPEFDQMLVAASPRDDIADTHWYRADVDEWFVCEAQRLGVDFADEVALESFAETCGLVQLEGERRGEPVAYQARFVVDASGPHGFLHRALGSGDAAIPEYPGTQALYSHFSGVRHLASQLPYVGGRDEPYPIDAAAVHHVFDGGWIWVLQFNNGLTSAGVAATDMRAEELRLAEGEAAWNRLLKKIPALAEQFAEAVPKQPFRYVAKLSFRSSAIVADRWAMLPSAAGFVDPLLSTGFPLTLLGVSRLAEIVERSWCAPKFVEELHGYAEATGEELLATARLIAALYANMGDFPVFRSISLLYFAAASYSETARRFGKPDLAKSFLLHDRPEFGPECRRLLSRLSGARGAEQRDDFAREIKDLIRPIDVAGLGKAARNGCYPVLAEDLLDSAWKLGATEDEAAMLLERAGFFAAPR